MLRFSRRVILLSLLAMVAFSVVLRYPLVEHERYQADSYYIHLLAGSIADEHRMAWALSPTSYFGYYPLSYPSGIPMLLAEVSEMTGLNIEACILVMGWIVGIALVLATFLLAREVLLSTSLSVVCALIVTVSPRIVDTTYWVGSARTPLVLMMIVIFFLISRQAQDTMRWKLYTALTAFAVVTATSIHHAAILLVVFGMIYVLSAVMVSLAKFRSYRDNRVKRAVVLYSVALISGILLTYLGLLGISQTGLDAVGGVFGDTTGGLNTTLAVLVSYVEQMSIGLVFGAFGVWYLLTKRLLTPKTVFVPLVIPTFIPIIGKTLYLSPLLTPFIAIVVAQGYLWIWDRKRFRSAARFFVVGLVMVSLLLPPVFVTHWNQESYVTNDTVEVRDDVVPAANYLRANFPKEPFVWNNEVLAAEIAAISGSVNVRGGVPSVIGDLVNISDVKDHTEQNHWPQSMYQWQIWSGENTIGDDMIYLMNYDGVKTRVDEFVSAMGGRTSYLFMVDMHAEENFTNTYSLNPSLFAKSALSGGYSNFDSFVVYCDERVAWYQVALKP